ncbi:acireductone synthase [Larsenimonas rhizosphaerae]|uniref:acireductone synthase n=1 Tax=Larsenimonas rhizosphaerae TaxID=2944682 RepID=UPI0020341CDB|nr:acireductone synthase [Larsenimonas rhizosphaerae]MCM2130124.1 acireductone synthase [Larsenimonas rhizosphaerae]
MIRAVITDIEGTTSSIAFVHDILFPHAYKALPEWLEAHADEPAVADCMDEVRADAGAPEATTGDVAGILRSWMDEDRKATPLKSLQGMIWETGYRQGEFTGHLYPDVVRQLERWKQQGAALYIYSSGSVYAQKLMFGHSDEGDLTPLFSGYFDTAVGGKRDAESYRVILDELGLHGSDVLFLSDVVEELDAAQNAGLRTCQVCRSEGMVTGTHPVVSGFDEVSLDGND